MDRDRKLYENWGLLGNRIYFSAYILNSPLFRSDKKDLGCEAHLYQNLSMGPVQLS